ncbi:MAG: hypothetical protein Q9168_002832 [Polycauliona sp. 1 TL-2023]
MTFPQTCFDKRADASRLSSVAEQERSQNHTQSGFEVPAIARPSPSLPSNVAVEPITTATVSSFRRIIGLLLPIRYPDKFFAESVANATSSSLARVAVWHEGTPPGKRKQIDALPVVQGITQDGDSSQPKSKTPNTASQHEATPVVVGGIQCRIEQLPCHPSLSTSPNSTNTLTGGKSYCYIQTLALLSPYRSKGIAAALLEVIITTLCKEHCYAGTTSIYAHVWEEHEEALEWYIRRGFQVSKDVVKGYYRRLKPDGARIVWRDLVVSDYLRAQSREADDFTSHGS